MDASNLTPQQGERLAEAVGPMLGYVCKLAHRMQRMGWKPDDPLYVAAWDSYHALHALHVHARYASCHPGTAGKPSEPPPPAQPPDRAVAADVRPGDAGSSEP